MNDEERKAHFDLPKRIDEIFNWPDAKLSLIYLKVQVTIAEWLNEQRETKC